MKYIQKGKRRCLKYALDKKEIDAINHLLESHDPETNVLGVQMVLTSRVFRHYKAKFNHFRDSKGNYCLYKDCSLLQLISK